MPEKTIVSAPITTVLIHYTAVFPSKSLCNYPQIQLYLAQIPLYFPRIQLYLPNCHCICHKYHSIYQTIPLYLQQSPPILPKMPLKMLYPKYLGTCSNHTIFPQKSQLDCDNVESGKLNIYLRFK